MEIKNEKAAKVIAGCLVAAGVLLLAVIFCTSLGVPGKYMLQGRIKGSFPSLYGEKEEMIRSGDKIYRYRKDIITILCMGIDNEGKVTEQTDEAQADALFLAVVDPEKKSVRIVGIPRDTMAELEVRDTLGNYLWMTDAQLTLQYVYGDGKESSCELMAQAVSKLLFDLPINGYCTMNLGAIKEINNLAGGVEVTIREDLTLLHPQLQKGKTLVLDAEQAFAFVKERSTKEEGSSYGRLERQKQYLGSLAGKMQQAVKKNPFLLHGLIKSVADYTITDLNAAELAYLAGVCISGGVNVSRIDLLPGKIVQGERYEEFHIDEEAVKELLLEIYYEEI